MGDINDMVDMSVSASACSFDTKLVATYDELLVFQHIDKSTSFWKEQCSLFAKDPTDVSYLDSLGFSGR